MSKLLTFVTFLLLPISVFAQSPTDKLHGPHAGKVLGAGDVLAEVVWWGKDKVEVYFLNRDWVDILDSDASIHVDFQYQKSPKAQPINCSAGTSHNWTCILPDYKSLSSGDKLLIDRNPKSGPSKRFEYVFEKKPKSSK